MSKTSTKADSEARRRAAGPARGIDDDDQQHHRLDGVRHADGRFVKLHPLSLI